MQAQEVAYKLVQGIQNALIENPPDGVDLSLIHIFIRLSVASPSGPYRIPAKGCLHPDSVPANLLGIVLVDFFDKNLMELRLALIDI